MSEPDTHYTFDTQYQRYKRLRYDYNTRQWVFQDWMPQGWQLPLPPGPSNTQQHHRADSANTVTGAAATYVNFQSNNAQASTQPTSHAAHSAFVPRRLGGQLAGTYNGPNTNTAHFEEIDPTYYVRSSSFFVEGRVFSVIMSETAGANSTQNITDYNSNTSLNQVKYKDNYVYTNVRRFVVVRQKREFCYGCPIFTYSGKATTKRGVRPSEHGVAYSWGGTPQMITGEGGITKPSIAVVMADNVPTLSVASRIYYGIIHPIQYNVKVKDVGYVVPDHVPTLIGNWREEDANDTQQTPHVTNTAEIPEASNT